MLTFFLCFCMFLWVIFVSKGLQRVPCCLEVVKYLRASKKPSFRSPGMFFVCFLFGLEMLRWF